jgi:hypothetical protein
MGVYHMCAYKNKIMILTRHRLKEWGIGRRGVGK